MDHFQGLHFLLISHQSTSSLPGYLKNRVDAAEVRSAEELKNRITTETATVTPQMLNNGWRTIENRLDILRAPLVAPVEAY
ncbi:hypothetical protein AVEN_64000-1 [Araneus ventricosus]|uniref:Uncharacterized protein n=1 Tax=Araneus ventricosus TaxID=182803 RepID=A0A4Y2VK69_ARAVE|nr:hypothetical protein AVEN_64000-1 [Araneus ventricosus]